MVSDSASNLLDVNGRLPEDRDHMLSVIDGFLDLSPREKRAFSLESMLRSFNRQYEGLTEEIMTAVGTYLTSGRIDYPFTHPEHREMGVQLPLGMRSAPEGHGLPRFAPRIRPRPAPHRRH